MVKFRYDKRTPDDFTIGGAIVIGVVLAEILMILTGVI